MRRLLLATAAAATIVTTGLVAPQQASAQVLTIDPAQIVQVAKTAVNTAQQVQQLIQVGQQVFAMARSIGPQGPMELASFALRNAEELNEVAPRFEITDLLASRGGATSWANNDGTSSRIDWEAPTEATFETPQSASDWVRRSFYVANRTLNVNEQLAYQELREGNRRQAAISAYGVSAYARQMAARLPEIQEVLATEARSSTDLRTDVAANTAALLAVHERLAHIHALLAAQLELEAADTIANDRIAGAAPAGAGGN